MRKLSRVLRRLEFHLLLFVVALLGFCKPVLLAWPGEQPARVMAAFFVPWALVVALLFCASRRGGEASAANGHHRIGE
jgi:hypothetical protein